MIEQKPNKKNLSLLDRLYNYDDKNLNIHTRKKLMHNNMARTKAVDKLCKFIINCTNKKVAKKNPEITIEYLKNFCMNRLDLNREIRHKTTLQLEKINIEKNKIQYTNDEGVEWITK